MLILYNILQVLTTPRIAIKILETAMGFITEPAPKQLDVNENSTKIIKNAFEIMYMKDLVTNVQLCVLATSFVLTVLCLQNQFSLGLYSLKHSTLKGLIILNVATICYYIPHHIDLNEVQGLLYLTTLHS